MLVDEDPFPPMATVNTATFDLCSLINHKRRMREEIQIEVLKEIQMEVLKEIKIWGYNVRSSRSFGGSKKEKI